MKVKKICWNCGKEFEVENSRNYRKFCCDKCYKQFRETKEYKQYVLDKIKQGEKWKKQAVIKIKLFYGKI